MRSASFATPCSSLERLRKLQEQASPNPLCVLYSPSCWKSLGQLSVMACLIASFPGSLRHLHTVRSQYPVSSLISHGSVCPLCSAGRSTSPVRRRDHRRPGGPAGRHLGLRRHRAIDGSAQVRPDSTHCNYLRRAGSTQTRLYVRKIAQI